MRHRHAISDDDWDRITELLPGRPGQHGKVTRGSRLFVDAAVTISVARQIRFATQASSPGDFVRVFTAFSPTGAAVREPATSALAGVVMAGLAHGAWGVGHGVIQDVKVTLPPLG